MAKWKKSKIITVSTILAIFLVAIVVFLCFVPTIEAEVARKKYYNERVAYFEIENSKAANSKLVFLGDGITEQYDLKKYYSLYSNKFNRGIAGDTTFTLQDRLIVSLLNVRPVVCVLLIGTNNINSALKNYEEILQEIKDKSPQTKMIIQSIYPTAGEYHKRNKKIVEVNEEIKKLAQKYGYDYADVYSVLKDEKGELNSKYTTDGLHLNNDGYKAVTSVLTPIISKYIN